MHGQNHIKYEALQYTASVFRDDVIWQQRVHQTITLHPFCTELQRCLTLCRPSGGTTWRYSTRHAHSNTTVLTGIETQIVQKKHC